VSNIKVNAGLFKGLDFLILTNNYIFAAIAQAVNLADALILVELWEAHPENRDPQFVVDYVGSCRPSHENATVIKSLHDGEIDIVIHVGMLGEGFNCPLLSVCCIFRRFASFAPFAQFVGRAVRSIEGTLNPADWMAYIVCHPALGLGGLWSVYKNQEVTAPNDALFLRTVYKKRKNRGRYPIVFHHELGTPTLDWYLQHSK